MIQKGARRSIIPPDEKQDWFGRLWPGWTREMQVLRLEYLASRCEQHLPERAAWLREWAARLLAQASAQHSRR